MINKFIGVGHLGRDVELKEIQPDNAVGEFSIAVQGGKEPGGNYGTEWLNVVVWGNTARHCQQYLKKGSKVYIEGRLQTRSWDSDTGKKYKTEVVAYDVKFLDSKKTTEKADAAF